MAKKKATAKFDDDIEFYRELTEIFLQDAPQQLVCLKESLEKKDAEGVETHAHKLKGASGNFGLEYLSRLCSELQRYGCEGNIDEASRIYLKVSSEYKQVELALKESIKDIAHK